MISIPPDNTDTFSIYHTHTSPYLTHIYLIYNHLKKTQVPFSPFQPVSLNTCRQFPIDNKENGKLKQEVSFLFHSKEISPIFLEPCHDKKSTVH